MNDHDNFQTLKPQEKRKTIIMHTTSKLTSLTTLNLPYYPIKDFLRY